MMKMLERLAVVWVFYLELYRLAFEMLVLIGWLVIQKVF
jgi:hypothetical protein